MATSENAGYLLIQRWQLFRRDKAGNVGGGLHHNPYDIYSDYVIDEQGCIV
jgi:hypothetical protein